MGLFRVLESYHHQHRPHQKSTNARPVYLLGCTAEKKTTVAASEESIGSYRRA